MSKIYQENLIRILPSDFDAKNKDQNQRKKHNTFTMNKLF